jgi:glucokinase
VDGRHAIGVDLGGTKILAGVVTRSGEIVRRHERPTPTDSQEELARELVIAVEELIGDDVAALGLGVPGPIDLASGRTYDMVNLPFHDFPLRDHMSEHFGRPVGLDNDANAASIAEWRVGAARGVDNVVMLTLGTGLGGGVISEGAPFRAGGRGAELGHVVIVHDGRECQGNCLGRGHLEPYVTGLAATKAAQAAFGPDADARSLVELADGGDERARAVLAEIGSYLGSGMGSFANLFAPELIVIGGGFGVAAWTYLMPTAEAVMRREALRPMRDTIRVVRAELGTSAGLIGAGFVGFEALDKA